MKAELTATDREVKRSNIIKLHKSKWSKVSKGDTKEDDKEGYWSNEEVYLLIWQEKQERGRISIAIDKTRRNCQQPGGTRMSLDATYVKTIPMKNPRREALLWCRMPPPKKTHVKKGDICL